MSVSHKPLPKWLGVLFIVGFCILVLQLVQNSNSRYKEWHELPGAKPFSNKLKKKIMEAMTKTQNQKFHKLHHVNPDQTPKFTNRLALESSPYLLQHAHNPVNWYPWSDQAFEIAAKEKKPVLLSIGYSTCHWCHVMEEESFEDLEIAQYLNQNYVAIKVDREQRPDVDAVYMAAVQAFSGSGGWPMTVWMTPDRKPFYGGTYFPARDGDRGARMGFLTLLKRLREAYDAQPDKIMQQSEELVRAVQAQTSPQAGEKLPSVQTLHEAYFWYKNQFDPIYGGFGMAPKFPRPVSLEFLFHYGARAQEPKAIEMATFTLKKMARGGMYDQLGGGFHRYSVDHLWLVPHFEKMLYDNAQLVIAYLEAYQLTQDQEFADLAKETLDYVVREMTHPQGGFYSATDADSEGEEGKFFVWSKKEIIDVLGDKDGSIFCEFYGVTEEGNFEGQNILHVQVPKSEFAKKLQISLSELVSILTKSKEKLYQVRLKRIPPITDDKILAAWNGLMIGAFARGAFVLNESKFLNVASKAADFVLTNLREKDQLYRSFREGKAQFKAYLDDYAFLSFGLLELFEASGETRWLKQARELTDTLLKEFWDEKNSGFFMTSQRHEKLLTREKPYYDGAEPSGNSVAAMNLLRLESLTTETKYGLYAEKIFKAFEEILEKVSHASPYLLAAFDYHLDRAKEIVLVSSKSNLGNTELVKELQKQYLPNRVIMMVHHAKSQKEMEKLVPLVKSKTAQNNQPTAYVCENQTCEFPTTDPKVFAEQLGKIHPLPKS